MKARIFFLGHIDYPYLLYLLFSMTSEYTEVRASRSKIPLKENVKTIKIQQEQSKSEPTEKPLSADQEKRWKTRQVGKIVIISS